MRFVSDGDRAAYERFFVDRELARGVFEALPEALPGLAGPDVSIAATKSRVSFVRRTRFLWAHEATREGVWLGFLVDRPLSSARLRGGKKGNRHGYHLKLTGPADPELVGWLRAALDDDRP